MIAFGSEANDDGSWSLYYSGRLVGHYARAGQPGPDRWRGVTIHGRYVYASTQRAVEAELMRAYG